MKLTRMQIEAVKGELRNQESKHRERLSRELEASYKPSPDVKKVAALCDKIIKTREELESTLDSICSSMGSSDKIRPYILVEKDKELLLKALMGREIKSILPDPIDYFSVERALIIESINSETFNLEAFLKKWLSIYE